jgi:hypothetical protein
MSLFISIENLVLLDNGSNGDSVPATVPASGLPHVRHLSGNLPSLGRNSRLCVLI